jgi:hypothetical protein
MIDDPLDFDVADLEPSSFTPIPFEPLDELPDFALLYDERELARMDRGVTAPPAEPASDGVEAAGEEPAPRRTGSGSRDRMRRLGAAGAIVGGIMVGLGEVLEPDGEKQTMIEFAPDRLPEDEQLVTFHLVPGDPLASRLVVRPWVRRRRH